jgi:hypothetical protein
MVAAWDEPMKDIGPAGEDQGKRGKYLLLPPDDFKGDTPGRLLFGQVSHIQRLRAVSGDQGRATPMSRLRWRW